MSIDKSELKMLTIASMGSKIDDFLEDQQKLLHQARGAGEAFDHISREINKQIMSAISKDIDDGKYETLEHPTEIKRWVARCSELAAHLSLITKERQIKIQGGIDQLNKVIEFMRKEHEAERNKKELLRKAAEGRIVNDAESTDGTIIPMRRPTGVHPGMSVKARRLIQAKTASEDVELNTESEEELPKPSLPSPPKIPKPNATTANAEEHTAEEHTAEEQIVELAEGSAEQAEPVEAIEVQEEKPKRRRKKG